jgi:hypothetical protein
LRIAFTLGAAKNASLAMLVCCGVLVFGGAAAAEEAPRAPEEVDEYFSSGLLPRLTDLYGPGVGGEAGIDFAEPAATIGPITRVMVWTKDFRAGLDTDHAVELSNSWVAPITRGGPGPDAAADAAQPADEVQLGLATVWISPHSDSPELASFDPSPVLGPALARAPEGAVLVYDGEQDAWYGLAGDQLIPLAQAGNAISSGPVPLRDAQQTLWRELETLPGQHENSGFVVAALTLAVVVMLLAVFVLVPDRRRAAVHPEVAPGLDPGDGQRE